MNKKKIIVLLALAAAVIVTMAAVIFSGAFQQPESSENDYSKLSWTDAFGQLYHRISKEYAFTDWKGIDWPKLYEEYMPKIQSAQSENNFDAYYIALSDFINQIPDGHVRLDRNAEIDGKYIGGGFGFIVAKIEDGRIIVTWVDPSGPAWAAGIQEGAELIEWNGQPAGDAAAAVSTAFGGNSATKESLEYKKLQYLVRAPVGAQVSIALQNPGDNKLQEVSLAAYDDQRLSLKKTYPDSVISNKLRDMFVGAENPDPVPDGIVETKKIDGNIYYIKLWMELDADLQETGQMQSTLELFRRAVEEANEQKCTGLILDIRNNMGGLDNMAADILGSFYPKKTFYEYQKSYNSATGKHEIEPADSETGSLGLYIEPARQYFGGRIIALINQRCISSGEGIAMGIRNLPNGETLGFFGTNGSFGLAGAEAVMPGGLKVHWPSGQSLDENKDIQLDSRDGVGGVSPTIRIPMSAQNTLRAARGEDVELEEAVRILSSSGGEAILQ